MASSHEKALKKSSTGAFFDSLDKKLGNGKFATDKARVSVKPKKK